MSSICCGRLLMRILSGFFFFFFEWATTRIFTKVFRRPILYLFRTNLVTDSMEHCTILVTKGCASCKSTCIMHTLAARQLLPTGSEITRASKGVR
ncbi:hypothetical protein BGX38DRAFT_100953 [Terfezia claveryi]|nr:hypothetical protein BGX38DRAFT_100953 [Terfezia claveryi]